MPLRALITLVRYRISRWSLRKLQNPEWFSSKDSIFICSYFIHLDPDSCNQGRFHSRYWDTLPKYLNDKGVRINWLQMFLFSRVVPDVGTGIKWLRSFNGGANRHENQHTFLDSYMSWRVLFKVLAKYFWLYKVAWRLRQIKNDFYPKGSSCWLWPFLKNDWKNSLCGPGAITHCVHLELFDVAIKDLPHQKIGLYLYENQGWEKAFLRAWRRYGHGTIIGVAHTTIPFWLLPYAEDSRVFSETNVPSSPQPDLIAVNGIKAWNALVEGGVPVGRMVEVEALRYLNFLKIKTNQRKKKAGARILILGDLDGVPSDNFLLLIEKAMKMLTGDYRFTFKPHPGSAIKITDYPNLNATETTEPLDCILSEYDYALVSNNTSASIEAYMVGLCVIIGLDGRNINLAPMREHPGVRFVSTPKELAAALRNFEGVNNKDRIEEFYWLDDELTRWKRLFASK
jgi:surface carbohydrate biosynthesis protein (TIGR04326 family)